MPRKQLHRPPEAALDDLHAVRAQYCATVRNSVALAIHAVRTQYCAVARNSVALAIERARTLSTGARNSNHAVAFVPYRGAASAARCFTTKQGWGNACATGRSAATAR